MNDSKIKLIPPDTRYRDSYVAALREGLHLEQAKEEDIFLAEKDFKAYLAKRNDPDRPVVLPDGKQVIPVEATSSDGIDRRKITPIVTRKTE